MSALLVAETLPAAMSIDQRPKYFLQSFSARLDSEKGKYLPTVLDAIRTLEACTAETP